VNGIYRYNKGFNPVGLGVLAVTTGIIFLGEFVKSVGWLYEYAWFVGLILAFVSYLAAVWVIRSTDSKLKANYEPRGTFGVELVEAAKEVPVI